MKVLALGDPHGKLPKNLDRIIKKNKIELIISIGEVYPIKRDKNHKGTADLEGGEKVINKLLSYKIPLIFFKGNMFLSKKGSPYFTKLVRKLRKKHNFPVTPDFIFRIFSSFYGINLFTLSVLYFKNNF